MSKGGDKVGQGKGGGGCLLVDGGEQRGIQSRLWERWSKGVG